MARDGLPWWLNGKETACNAAGEADWIPGWGRLSGGGHGKPTPVLSPGKSMDGGAWWATVHGVTKSQIRLK